eukprot:scaffold52094_cov48-Prasinocladus_malaysianus.AAC.1
MRMVLPDKLVFAFVSRLTSDAQTYGQPYKWEHHAALSKATVHCTRRANCKQMLLCCHGVYMASPDKWLVFVIIGGLCSNYVFYASIGGQTLSEQCN